MHGVHIKETYENIKNLLQKIQYAKHSWKICSDLKVVGMLLGMQAARARSKHYIQKEWPKRTDYVPNQKSVSNLRLVEPENIVLPPLHIKLGLMKNFVKAMDKTGEGFQYLKSIFPRLSDPKLKEGIFVGPDIRRVMKDQNFVSKLNTLEKKHGFHLLRL